MIHQAQNLVDCFLSEDFSNYTGAGLTGFSGNNKEIYFNGMLIIYKSKNDKKLVITVRNYSDTSLAASKFEKLVTFFYPFVTVTGEYRAYKIEFTIKTEDMDIHQVRQLIESIEFPGKSPFTE